MVRSALLAWLALVVAHPSAAAAHERRTLAGGKYDVIVGWQTEPAYVNQHNAVGIRISRAGTNPAEPVTGVERTLQVEVSQAGQSRTFALRAEAGQPGYYVADIVPTQPGDLAWRFSGAIGSDPVDESFLSADGKIDPVVSTSSVEFPVAAPDPEQAAVELRSARAAADRAQTFAFLGVGLGVVGILLALLACFSRPRPGSGVLSSRDAAVRRAPGSGGIRAG